MQLHHLQTPEQFCVRLIVCIDKAELAGLDKLKSSERGEFEVLRDERDGGADAVLRVREFFVDGLWTLTRTRHSLVNNGFAGRQRRFDNRIL